MKITQLCVDSTAIYFKDNLKKRYNFSDYLSKDEPTLFFGIMNQVDLINSHRGYKVVNIISPVDGGKVNWITPSDKLFFKKDKIAHGPNLLDIPDVYKTKDLIFETKPYDNYIPNELGENVYVYLGSEGRKHSEFGFSRIEQLAKKSKFKFLYGLPQPNNVGYPESYFKTNFYDKSFVNINLSVYNGLQGMIELAFMGRKTIANFHRHFECVINYKDDEHILEIIEAESKKIGTIQPSINVHTANDDWLNIDWWKQ